MPAIPMPDIWLAILVCVDRTAVSNALAATMYAPREPLFGDEMLTPLLLQQKKDGLVKGTLSVELRHTLSQWEDCGGRCVAGAKVLDNIPRLIEEADTIFESDWPKCENVDNAVYNDRGLVQRMQTIHVARMGD